MARRVLALSLLLAAFAIPAGILSQAAAPVTTPRQQFGASIGDDYFLATYSQLERYWQTLARETERLHLVDIGLTEEGRHQWMAILTAPDNFAKLDRYQAIARRLALADGLDDEQARTLAREGKAVVWIGGGLHADETLGAQQLIELVYQLASRSDPETLRILRDTIVLVANANPDGQELVASWYMRERVPYRRSLDGLPRLYQKYVGHDNNRDFYMATQAETANVNRVLYQQWFPQIVYDHHQPAPDGTVMFAPPFRGPSNYLLDPLLPSSIDAVGAAIHARFADESKPGVTMGAAAEYSTWWNGGLRTTANFHNQIGLLSETAGEPWPVQIPYVAERQQPTADLPHPIQPQWWHFRQSVDYSITANRAVLDYASRHREDLLFGIYRMGRNAIERGRREARAAAPAAVATPQSDRHARAPRAYIIPADQPDFPTAVKFVDALLKNGVRVLRASHEFSSGARTYPAGSFVISTAQAFRPYVLDMFEPQEYPRQGAGRGGAEGVYDTAGWTLAYQMGVAFERAIDAPDGPFVPVTTADVPPGEVVDSVGAVGYLFSHSQNNAFTVLNRLLAAGEDVYWVEGGSSARPAWHRAMYVAARPSTRPLLDRAARELGVSFAAVSTPPAGAALRVRPVRIGLWDQYGGSIPSGWTRWLLEQFEFPFERVYVQALDAGRLASRFDVIILPDDAVPSGRSRRDDGSGLPDVPDDYRTTTGTMTWERTVPPLKQFVQDGGTLLLVGGATAIAPRIGAPIADALVTADRAGERPLRRDEVDVPGSILRARVEASSPLAYGIGPEVDLVFDNSPVFRIVPGTRYTRERTRSAAPPAGPLSAGARRVAWFATAMPLRSGWALGQQRLLGGVAVADVTLGAGHVAVFGPLITFRAQSHATFKFLFNGIFYGKAVALPRVPAGSR